MKSIFILLTTILACHAYADQNYPVRIPEGSPFSLKELQHGYDPIYTGELTFTGKFEASWKIIDEKPDHLDLIIYPPENIAELIPYQRNKAWELIVNNTETVLTGLLPSDQLKKILTHEILQVNGIADFTINTLNISGECDRYYYYVIVSSAKNVKELTFREKNPNGHGC